MDVHPTEAHQGDFINVDIDQSQDMKIAATLNAAYKQMPDIDITDPLDAALTQVTRIIEEPLDAALTHVTGTIWEPLDAVLTQVTHITEEPLDAALALATGTTEEPWDAALTQVTSITGGSWDAEFKQLLDLGDTLSLDIPALHLFEIGVSDSIFQLQPVIEQSNKGAEPLLSVVDIWPNHQILTSNRDVKPKTAALKSTYNVEDLLQQHNYDDALKEHKSAMSKYESGIYLRNTLDDMRLSLELLVKDILHNDKSLENQISGIGNMLKTSGYSAELRDMVQPFIRYYTMYQNNHVKHKDEVKSDEVGFIIDITNAMMKLLIQANKVRIDGKNELTWH